MGISNSPLSEGTRLHYWCPLKTKEANKKEANKRDLKGMHSSREHLGSFGSIIIVENQHLVVVNIAALAIVQARQIRESKSSAKSGVL